jgi:hypothetical protein
MTGAAQGGPDREGLARDVDPMGAQGTPSLLVSSAGSGRGRNRCSFRTSRPQQPAPGCVLWGTLRRKGRGERMALTGVTNPWMLLNVSMLR